jgi:hypothetical protein
MAEMICDRTTDDATADDDDARVFGDLNCRHEIILCCGS